MNLDDTIYLIRCMEHVYRRKNTKDLDLEVRRNIRFIFDKDFILNSDTSYSLKYSTNEFSIKGNSKILEQLTAEIEIHGKRHVIFLPIIYYMLANVSKIGRMVVYKKDRLTKHQSRYLVHRSNIDMYPLEHPGGHIEFIEFFDNRYEPGLCDTLRSGKPYVLRLIYQILQSPKHNVDMTTKPCIDVDTLKWIFCGTCREVLEESGLNLYNYAHKTDLIKIGMRTYYFSVELDYEQKEAGPLDRFKNEIFTNDDKHDEKRASGTNKFSNHMSPAIAITKPRTDYVESPIYHPMRDRSDSRTPSYTPNPVSVSPNYYSILRRDNDQTVEDDTILNTISGSPGSELWSDRQQLLSRHSELDKFWEQRFDRQTFHAWISSDEMKQYWDNKYLYHISDVVAITD